MLAPPVHECAPCKSVTPHFFAVLHLTMLGCTQDSDLQPFLINWFAKSMASTCLRHRSTAVSPSTSYQAGDSSFVCSCVAHTPNILLQQNVYAVATAPESPQLTVSWLSTSPILRVTEVPSYRSHLVSRLATCCSPADVTP